MKLKRPGMRRSTWRFVLAVAATVFAVAAALWPQWIEAFGVDPDHGDGLLEWAVPGLLALAALILAGAGYRRRRLEMAGAAAA